MPVQRIRAPRHRAAPLDRAHDAARAAARRPARLRRMAARVRPDRVMRNRQRAVQLREAVLMLRDVCMERDSDVQTVAAAVARVTALRRKQSQGRGGHPSHRALRGDRVFDTFYTHATLALVTREQWDKVVALAPLGRFQGQAPLVHIVAVTARVAIPAGVLDALGANALDSNGATPLLSACAPAVRSAQARRAGIIRPHGGLPVIAGLLAHPAVNKHAVDQHKRTALHRACTDPCAPAPIVKALLEAGIQVDRVDDRGVTALHLACRGRTVDTEVVEALVAYSAAGAACATRQDFTGRTPLLDVCLSGSPHAQRVAGYLLDRAGADVTICVPDFASATPLVEACRSGSLSLVRRLIADERVNVNTDDAILECIGYETPSAVRQLPNPSVRRADDVGDHAGVLKALLSFPGSLATFDRDLVTPMAMGLHVRARVDLVDRLRTSLVKTDRWTRRKPLLMLRLLAESRRGRIVGGQRRGNGWEVGSCGVSGVMVAKAGHVHDDVRAREGNGTDDSRPSKRRRVKVVARKVNPQLAIEVGVDGYEARDCAMDGHW